MLLLPADVLPGSSPSFRSSQAVISGYLSAQGAKLVDATGKEVRLTGVNWFGLETAAYAPHGLWSRNWEDMLDQVVALGFNTIRLPFSNQLFDKDSQPNSIDFNKNPDLVGLSGLEIMDKIVQGAQARGLKIILDRHRPDSAAQSSLWYTDRYSEERWIADWKVLAKRYLGNDAVIGADLHNEPRNPATWGTGDPKTDWRLAAERAGNAILSVNPNLLIIVEGIETYNNDYYWWGGNLMGAGEHPVRLSNPSKLVYSAHDYGPGVYNQSWFLKPEFPANLPKLWDDHWGYLAKKGIAPVLMGEFGGRSVGADTEGIWQRAIFQYLKENNLSYTYWSLNPNSGDTGGILNDDWTTVNAAKMKVISTYLWPMLGETKGVRGSPLREETPLAMATPAPLMPTPPPERPLANNPDPPGNSLTTPTRPIELLYRTDRSEDKSNNPAFDLKLVNKGKDPISLPDVEVRYWLSAGNSGSRLQTASIDWASTGIQLVRSEFVPSPRGGQSHFLRIGFTGGSLTAAGGTVELKVRFNKSDWSEYLQPMNYSFAPQRSFERWERITVYLGGSLVWGVEPSGEAATPTAMPEPTATPAPEAKPSEESPPEARPARSLGDSFLDAVRKVLDWFTAAPKVRSKG